MKPRPESAKQISFRWSEIDVAVLAWEVHLVDLLVLVRQKGLVVEVAFGNLVQRGLVLVLWS